MASHRGIGLGIAALAVYVTGGFASFGGIALILFMKGHDLLGWGDGRTVGFLLLVAGAILSITGVLMMRVFRNRRPD